MKQIAGQSKSKAGFTIIELLTVMSIIIILIGLLTPGLNLAKRYARDVRQKAQFHSIDVGLDLFSAEQEGYPPSSGFDDATPPVQYCGAMKLAEAMVGQDLLGFHPNSRFMAAGTVDGTPTGTLVYDPADPDKSDRRNYLPTHSANAYKLKHLYGVGKTGPLDQEKFVLCDVYARVGVIPDPGDPGDKVHGKAGMPILYYRAKSSGTTHDVTNPANPQNIYDYTDNNQLVQLGFPWHTPPSAGGPNHLIASGGWPTLHPPPLDTSDPAIFYQKTLDDKINIPRPHRPDSFILLSAGFDGEYGTDDDIFNFRR